MIDFEKIERIQQQALHHVTIHPEAADPWDKLYLANVIFGLIANNHFNEEIETIAQMIEEQRFEVKYPVHRYCPCIDLDTTIKNIAAAIRERKRSL